VGGEGRPYHELIYNLPATQAIYQRFGGIDGSANFIGGFGMTALDRQQRGGSFRSVRVVGFRLGANSAISVHPQSTWNPF